MLRCACCPVSLYILPVVSTRLGLVAVVVGEEGAEEDPVVKNE